MVNEQSDQAGMPNEQPPTGEPMTSEMRAAVAAGQARLADLSDSAQQVAADKLLATLLAGAGKKY